MKDKYIYIFSKQKNESLSELREIESIEIKSNIVSILYEKDSLESINSKKQLALNINIRYLAKMFLKV